MLLLKKVVVYYPTSSISGQKQIVSKEFQVATEEEYLLVDNTDQGCLIVRCDAKLPKYQPVTLAVFKEWIYWERVD